MTTVDIDEQLKKAKWRHSVRGNGHEYVTSVDYAKLVEAVSQLVKSDGVVKLYKTYKVRYWLHGLYRYWVMPGVGNSSVMILNRALQKPKYQDRTLV